MGTTGIQNILNSPEPMGGCYICGGLHSLYEFHKELLCNKHREKAFKIAKKFRQNPKIIPLYINKDIHGIDPQEKLEKLVFESVTNK